MSKEIIFQYDDPFKLFSVWFELAKQKERTDPTEIALATVDEHGHPHIRMLLLKQFDQHGFVFYTNLNSHKAAQLNQNPNAAICIYWPDICRQIRINGIAKQLSDEQADSYFASRPRGSQIGAWASKQSQILHKPDELSKRVKEYEQMFAKQEIITRPPFWSGYCLQPDTMEFWIQGKHRLHQRMLFTRDANQWHKQRLYP